MFFRDTTVSTSYNGFGIRDDSVNPRQEPARRFRIAKNNFIMGNVRSLYRFSVGSPSIGADSLQKMLAFFRRGSIAESFQENLDCAGRSIFNYLHMCKTRLLFAFAVPIKGYCTQYSGFSFTSSARFMPFWTEKGIIHFDQTSQAVPGIPICHRFANLMGHQPRGLVICELQNTLHLGYRDAHLVHGHMVNKPIPFEQGRTSLMEYRSRRQTDFCPARFAIQNISGPDKPCVTMPAPWALKSLGPPNFSKMLKGVRKK